MKLGSFIEASQQHSYRSLSSDDARDDFRELRS